MTMLKYIILVLIFGNYVNSAKILGIFWTPSKSHHIASVPLLQALAKKGHEVHLLGSFNDKVEIPTYKQDLLTGILGISDVHANPNITFLDIALDFVPTQRKIAENFWKNDAVQNIIKNKPKYDLVIGLVFFNDFTFSLAKYLDLPLILISSAGSNVNINRFVGNPNLPYNKHVVLEQTIDTFFGRLKTVTVNILFATYEKYILAPIQDEVSKRYIPDAPTSQEIQKNVSLIFVNSHFSMEETRPYVPNMIPIGGFHAIEVKKLPEKFQTFLDSATNGVILFGMGTNVNIKTYFKDKIEILMKTFQKLAPVKILFKSEIEIPSAPKNVLVADWLPQNDILAHPNVKLFISHGGLGGITEAVYHGVPMLGIPFFGDQKSNIGFAVRAGFAVRLNYDDITEETFEKTIGEMLTNPMYIKNAKKRSSLFRTQPIEPMKKAIWWVEHIIEHKGGEHLRNMAVNFEWYQLYMVDIMLFYLILIVVSITISFYTTKWFVKKLYNTFIGCNKKNIEKIKEQ